MKKTLSIYALLVAVVMMVVMQAMPHHHHGSSACLAHDIAMTHNAASEAVPHAHGAQGEAAGGQCHTCLGCMAVTSVRTKVTVVKDVGRWLPAMPPSDNGIIRTDNITDNYGARRACALLALALQGSGGLRAPPINS